MAMSPVNRKIQNGGGLVLTIFALIYTRNLWRINDLLAGRGGDIYSHSWGAQ